MQVSRRAFAGMLMALAAGCRPRSPAARHSLKTQRVWLRLAPPRSGTPAEWFAFTVPFAPGELYDGRQVTLHTAAGQRLALRMHVNETWRHGAIVGSVRSATFLAKRHADCFDAPLALEVGVASSVGAEPLLGELGVEPVVALLPAAWLCRSRAGGLQLPTAATPRALRRYDDVAERAVPEVAQQLASPTFHHWLYDRTTALYRQYIRTGASDALRSAITAARFMMDHTDAEGATRGEFALKRGDIKYLYPQGMHIHYLLTGEPRARTLGLMMAEKSLACWTPAYDPARYSEPLLDKDPERDRPFWTPRTNGYAFLAAIHGWELSGEQAYWQRALDHVDALYAHQRDPQDGFPADGSWRQNWGTYDPGESRLAAATSSWVTAIMLEPMFQHWSNSGDPRIPEMIVAWCEFLDGRGFDPTTGLPYYVIDCRGSAHVTHSPTDPPDSMAQHALELAYTFAMGLYFCKPAARPRFQARFDALFAWTSKQLNLTREPRVYNWAFAASGQMMYLLNVP